MIIGIWIVFQILGNYFLYITSVTNPGIVPKLGVDARTLIKISSTKSSYPIKTFMAVKNNSTLNLSYWKECCIIRPPRWSHWYFWGNWVEILDHHCKWINWCVGKRNYGYFVLFISLITLFLLAQIISCIVLILIDSNEINIRIITEMAFWIFYLFWLLCFTGHLTIYHAYLIWIGETTRENIKKVFKNRTNPFAISIYSNWATMLCPFRGNNKLVEPFDMWSLKTPEKWRAAIELEALRSSVGVYKLISLNN